MKVQVIDPSNFSLPYDHSLCEALARQGCEVTLVRSRFAYWPWAPPASPLGPGGPQTAALAPWTRAYALPRKVIHSE